jgi:hypothetical protein
MLMRGDYVLLDSITGRRHMGVVYWCLEGGTMSGVVDNGGDAQVRNLAAVHVWR